MRTHELLLGDLIEKTRGSTSLYLDKSQSSVFKICRSDDLASKERLERELQIYKSLNDSLFAQIPDLLDYSFNKEICYIKLSKLGEKNLRFAYQDLTFQEKNQIFYNIGQLLRKTHDLDLAFNKKQNLNLESLITGLSKNSNDTFKTIKERLIIFLRNHNSPDLLKKSLVHGDFQDKNIMLSEDNKFVGVVDWSEVSIDNPEFELSINNICTYVKFAEEEELLQRKLLLGYGLTQEKTDNYLKQRNFYQGIIMARALLEVKDWMAISPLDQSNIKDLMERKLANISK